MDMTTEPDLPSSDRIPAGVVVFVMFLAFLWGCNIVAIKIGLAGVPPLAAAGIRFGIALPLIIVWAAFRGIPIVPTRSEMPRLLLVGLIFTVQIGLINLGTDRTQAARASVFLNAYPVFVAFISHFFVPNDRLTGRKVIGLAVAFAGLIVVFGRSLLHWDKVTLAGDLLVISSGILLAVLVVMISRLGQRTAPVRITVAELAVGVPLFFFFSAIFESGQSWSFSASVIVALCYQGFAVSAFCFVAWATLLKSYSPSKLSVLFFSTPVWGVIASILILGEGISWQLIAGAAFVAAGIYIVNRTPKRIVDAVCSPAPRRYSD